MLGVYSLCTITCHAVASYVISVQLEPCKVVYQNAKEFQIIIIIIITIYLLIT